MSDWNCILPQSISLYYMEYIHYLLASPLVLALATTALPGVHCLHIYIIWHTSRLNHTLVRGKRLSLYLRHFIMSHLHPNNICASWMLNSSTLSNQSPAAQHFLVDYSGFSLHSHTQTDTHIHTDTRRHRGLNKEYVTPIIFIVITVWEFGSIRNRSTTSDSVSLLTFLDEPDCILGSCFLVLLYEWSLYINILEPVIIFHTRWERLSGKLVIASQAEPTPICLYGFHLLFIFSMEA